jgi:DNA/RNA-binding domain of Phe-tRNA-synthetase-like protein
MSDRLSVSGEIFDRFPDYLVNIVEVRGVSNGVSDDWSLEFLRTAKKEVRQKFAAMRPADHPHIAAWRHTYSRFGSKPSRYPCSAEALLKRTLSGELPPINTLVDLYNAISVRHVLPVGGEDSDCLVGKLVLRLATGDEQFRESSSDPAAEPVVVTPGEPIWIDDEGVTCRRWNWRQGPRTALGPETQNAFFVLDALAPYVKEDLDRATDALISGLQQCFPGCEVETTGVTA